MYFEAIIHQKLPVADAQAAATAYRTTSQSYQTPCFSIGSDTFYLVADHYVDSPKAECAVLMERDGKFYQIESITSAWIDTNEEFEKSIVKAVTEIEIYGEVNIIFDKAKGTETANFECGCCGNGFTGNVKRQLEYDQDSGFGICPDCEQYY